MLNIWVPQQMIGGWGETGPTLAALDLNNLVIEEYQPEGTLVGAITGATEGSTVTLLTQSNADMFAKDGDNIEVGAAVVDIEVAAAPTITLRETYLEANNSPRDSVIPITVTDIHSAEAAALFARMTTQPSQIRKGHIDTLILALKSAGVWSKLDMLHIFAAPDSQAARLNWISSTGNCTAFNSTVFTEDLGYTGDGTGSYLGTGVNASALTRFQRDSAHLSAWSKSEVNASASFLIGLASSTTNSLRSRSTNFMQARVNDGTFTNISVPSSIGLSSANRSASNARQFYHNGVSVSTDATASTLAPPTSQVTYLRSNTTYGPHQISVGLIGASLTAGEEADAHAAIDAYLTAIEPL